MVPYISYTKDSQAKFFSGSKAMILLYLDRPCLVDIPRRLFFFFETEEELICGRAKGGGGNGRSGGATSGHNV